MRKKTKRMLNWLLSAALFVTPVTASAENDSAWLAPQAHFPLNGNYANSTQSSEITMTQAAGERDFGDGRLAGTQAARFTSTGGSGGTTAYATLGNINYEQDFTVSFWLNIEETGGKRVILSNKSGMQDYNTGWALYTNPETNTLNVYVKPDWGSIFDVPLITLSTNQWQHIAFTVNRQFETLKCYVNGEMLQQIQIDVKNDALCPITPDRLSIKTNIGESGDGVFNKNNGSEEDHIRFLIEDLQLQAQNCTTPEIKKLCNPNGTLPDDSDATLIFPVLSDVHVSLGKIKQGQERLKTALEYLNYIAPRQDAFCMTGDQVSYGTREEYNAFDEIYNRYALPNVQNFYNNDRSTPNTTNNRVIVPGNHDFWFSGKNDKGETVYNKDGEEVKAGEDPDYKNTNDKFRDYFNMPYETAEQLYFSTRINDYLFIGMASDEVNMGMKFSPEQLAWAKSLLEEENAKQQREGVIKPIFVLSHNAIQDSVNGSYRRGPNDAFKWALSEQSSKIIDDLLSPYPQVIYLSGHSHYSIAPPNCIYQDAYTSVTAGTLQYQAIGSGKVQGPDFNDYSDFLTSFGLLIKVYDDKTVIKRLDFMHGRDIASELVIPITQDLSQYKEGFLYSGKYDTTSPAFAEDASIEISNVTEDGFTFTFPQATDDRFLEGYVCEAIDAQGNVAGKIEAYSEYYKYPMPQILSFQFKGLQPGTKYRVKLSPHDTAYNYGAPLWADVTTIDASPKVSAFIIDITGASKQASVTFSELPHDLECVLAVAVYNEQNELVQFTKESLNVPKTSVNETYSMSFDTAKLSSGSYQIKAFLLDGMKTMKPLTEAPQQTITIP